MCQKISDGMINSAYPDQTAPCAVLVGSALFTQIYLSNTLSATVIKEVVEMSKSGNSLSTIISYTMAVCTNGTEKIKARQTLEAWASKGVKSRRI